MPLDAALEMIEKGYQKYQSDHWGPGFMFSGQFLQDHPDVVKKYQELIVDEVPPLKCYLRHVVASQCHETTHLIHNIKAPTLVIVGSKDTQEGGTGSHVSPPRCSRKKYPMPNWFSSRAAGMAICARCRRRDIHRSWISCGAISATIAKG